MLRVLATGAASIGSTRAGSARIGSGRIGSGRTGLVRTGLVRIGPASRRARATQAGPRETYSLRPTNAEKLATDAAILERAAQPTQPIRLHDLVRWQQYRDGPPEAELLANAAYVIHEITTRLARRLDAMRALPLLVVLNPHISRIYNIYYNSFRVMSSVSAPTNLAENRDFAELLTSLVEFHAETIPTLAQGFSQATELLSRDDINRVLGEHLLARIGTRILAEHHIALTQPIGPNFIGCIQTDLRPAQVVADCAKTVTELTSVQFGYTPSIKLDIGKDVTIAYPPNHLEYMVMELLKNAFNAVCMQGEAAVDEGPIIVTVIRSGQGVIVRLRDRGGGILPENEANVFKFSYTSVEREGEGLIEGVDSSLAGLGYGLPLSKAYAEFFGGKLQLQSYHGWGTDAYLTLKSPLISGYHRSIL